MHPTSQQQASDWDDRKKRLADVAAAFGDIPGAAAYVSSSAAYTASGGDANGSSHLHDDLSIDESIFTPKKKTTSHQPQV